MRCLTLACPSWVLDQLPHLAHFPSPGATSPGERASLNFTTGIRAPQPPNQPGVNHTLQHGVAAGIFDGVLWPYEGHERRHCHRLAAPSASFTVRMLILYAARKSKARPGPIHAKLYRYAPYRRSSRSATNFHLMCSGRTRYDRLLLIGKACVPLCIDALKAAVAEAKAGHDVNRYIEAWDHIRLAAPTEPEAKRDEAWIEQAERANKRETARLEGELKGYKNNLIKESIRVCAVFKSPRCLEG